MLNLEKTLARIAAIPAAVREKVNTALIAEGASMVSAMKKAAPVSRLERVRGQFRNSIHAYPNPKRDMSQYIIADAKDEKGRNIGNWIEHGHKAEDGRRIPGRPSFWPVFRALRKGMRRRLALAARKAAKDAFEG
jgi:hypothetical protein